MATKLDKGYVLMAFGKSGYYKMAINMAISLRYHDKDANITLIHDESSKLPLSHYFDNLIAIKREHLYTNRKLDPGKAKLYIYEYLPYKHNIYLDADGIAISKLSSLWDRLISSDLPVISQVVGTHKIEQGNAIPIMQWAWANDIWQRYSLNENSVLPAINSSFMYIRKNDDAAKIYQYAQDSYSNPIPLQQLRLKWGGTQPDELYMNIAFALFGIIPQLDEDFEPILFSRGLITSWKDKTDRHYILGIYGGMGFTHSSLLKYYDACMSKYCHQLGKHHIYKTHLFMREKHANKISL